MEDFRPLESLAKVVVIFFAVTGVLRVIEGFGGLLLLLPDEMLVGNSGGAGSPIVIAWQLLGTLGQLSYIVGGIIFLVWFYRAVANLTPLQADYTEASPSFAVISWFIPFLSFVRPYTITRNIWAQSDPEGTGEDSYFGSYDGPAPGFMKLWWTLFIICILSSTATGILAQFAGRGTLAALLVFTGLLWGVGALAAIRVVQSITQRQTERSKSLGDRLRRSSEPPPPPVFDDMVGEAV